MGNEEATDEAKVEAMASILKSKDEDCKLAAEIGQAILAKYEELYQQCKTAETDKSRYETLAKDNAALASKQQNEITGLKKKLAHYEKVSCAVCSVPKD